MKLLFAAALMAIALAATTVENADGSKTTTNDDGSTVTVPAPATKEQKDKWTEDATAKIVPSDKKALYDKYVIAQTKKDLGGTLTSQDNAVLALTEYEKLYNDVQAEVAA